MLVLCSQQPVAVTALCTGHACKSLLWCAQNRVQERCVMLHHSGSARAHLRSSACCCARTHSTSQILGGIAGCGVFMLTVTVRFWCLRNFCLYTAERSSA
jgi:hypothetical protein